MYTSQLSSHPTHVVVVQFTQYIYIYYVNKHIHVYLIEWVPSLLPADAYTKPIFLSLKTSWTHIQNDYSYFETNANKRRGNKIVYIRAHTHTHTQLACAYYISRNIIILWKSVEGGWVVCTWKKNSNNPKIKNGESNKRERGTRFERLRSRIDYTPVLKKKKNNKNIFLNNIIRARYTAVVMVVWIHQSPPTAQHRLVFISSPNYYCLLSFLNNNIISTYRWEKKFYSFFLHA